MKQFSTVLRKRWHPHGVERAIILLTNNEDYTFLMTFVSKLTIVNIAHYIFDLHSYIIK